MAYSAKRKGEREERKEEIGNRKEQTLGEGQVLVRNYYSLISAGTEGSTVKAARKGYIGKARERPQ